jgi:glycosyltransferase involved in cell wall biosynthesis
LASEAARRGLTTPVLLTTHPFVAAAARGDVWRHVTYYGYDDWAAHPAYAPWHQAFVDAYEQISRSGHRVVAVSRRILERVGSPGAGAVVPNGVIADEWITPVSAPRWFDELPGPRLLYTGTLDTRLEISWLLELAQAFPQGNVVLVGFVPDGAALKPLQEVTNIHVHEWVPRALIRGITFAADVALIPHVSSALTEAMSPLKLYEYLSAGRPVVASDLEPIRGVAEARRATSAESFVEQVRAALLTGPAREDDRLKFIAANSWEARLDDVLQAAL